MNARAETDAEQSTREFLRGLRKLVEEVSDGGLVVAVDPMTLKWCQEVFFAARDTQQAVTERHKGHDDTVPRALTLDEWRTQLRALNALGSLLSTFDKQIPGGIPEEASAESTIMVDRSWIDALRTAFDSSANTRQGVYDRTACSFASQYPVTSAELYAYESPLGVLRDFLADIDAKNS